MQSVAPVSLEEYQEGIEAKVARGGLFAVRPATIRGVDYARVFEASEQCIRDFLVEMCAPHAPREFLIHDDTRISFHETLAQSARLANALISRYGAGPGQCIGIAMRNSPQWVLAWFAITATGATAVPLNAWWQTSELAYALRDTGTRLVFCDTRRSESLQPLVGQLDLYLIRAGDADVPAGKTSAPTSLSSLLAGEASNAMPTVAIDPDSVFCIPYTSGSTGNPKGVMQSHRGVITALLSWSFQRELTVEMRPELMARAPADPKILMPLPLFHATASHANLLLSVVTGRSVVFMDRWNPEQAIKLINQERVTSFSGVPTMTSELVAAAGPHDLASLLDISAGGAKRPEAHVAEQHKRFPEIAPSTGYGLTETNALAAAISMTDYVQRPGSTGRVIPPVTEIEIRDPHGRPVPTGTLGEVTIKSPATFVGYLNQPEATSAVINADGWFRSGDLGRFDADGFLYIVDRIKDIIIRGGENISCLEVENAAYQYPGVREAVVFPVPDDRFNEIVGIAVYAPDNPQFDLTALHGALAGSLARFKVPEKFWIFDDPLPRGGTDKLAKREVRRLALQRDSSFSP